MTLLNNNLVKQAITEHLAKIKIKDMKVGEYGYISTMCLHIDKEGNVSIDDCVLEKESMTYNIKVNKTEQGYVVTLPTVRPFIYIEEKLWVHSKSVVVEEIR